MTSESTSPPALPDSIRHGARKLCKGCWRPIEGEHRYCPYCGHRQTHSDAWYYHPLWVTVLALTVLGPFALPLVWKSRRMTVPAKVVLSTIIVAYGIVTIYYAYAIVKHQWSTWNQLDEILNLY